MLFNNLNNFSNVLNWRLSLYAYPKKGITITISDSVIVLSILPIGILFISSTYYTVPYILFFIFKIVYWLFFMSNVRWVQEGDTVSECL